MKTACENYLETGRGILPILRNLKHLCKLAIEPNSDLVCIDRKIQIIARPLSPSYRRGPAPNERKRLTTKERLLYIETLAKALEALNKLSGKQREAIYWRFIDHSEHCEERGAVRICRRPSNREIAHDLGISEGAFRQRLRIATSKLGFDDTNLELWLESEKKVLLSSQ